MGKKEAARVRHNLSVSADEPTLEEIDALVRESVVDTSRSGIAFAAIKEGLPALAARIRAGASGAKGSGS